MEARIKELEDEVLQLKTELEETKTHLKRYTAPAYKKEYYEKNKEIIKERNMQYKAKTNYRPTSEQMKEYNRRAYLKRKEKQEKQASE